jgi:DNA-binding MarR family transcriptional regulator
VDAILADWARERPDLDFSPVGIITRLSRIRAHLDAELAAVFRRFDLSPADFQVIVALRRRGAPYRMSQAALMAQQSLTSGTISVRVDRMVKLGLVEREASPDDARVALVRLTEDGLRLFDEVAPVHLANEDRLLSALDDDDRRELAGLLRRLLASFERGTVDVSLPLGLRVEPAHVARARRVAVGLSDTPGLLVVETIAGTPAAEAGVLRGDLLVSVGGVPVRSGDGIAAALRSGRSRRAGQPVCTVLGILRGNEPLQLPVTLPGTGTD